MSDFNIKIQKNQTVTNQPNRSNDKMFMLNTMTTTVPFLSRASLAPPNIVDPYYFISTNSTPLRKKKTKVNLTANQCERLYQPHTAPNIVSSATLPSSSSAANPINPFPMLTLNYTVSCVAMNKSVKTFDGFDHQNTPKEYWHQIDAHIIFPLGEQTLDPVLYNEWQ